MLAAASLKISWVVKVNSVSTFSAQPKKKAGVMRYNSALLSLVEGIYFCLLAESRDHVSSGPDFRNL
jgi:hypothetical protein